jgi:hypothetical protein
MYGLRFSFEGRLTNTGAPNNPTALLADLPFSMINRIQISGNHRPRNVQEDLLNLRGPDLYRFMQYCSGVTPLNSATPAFAVAAGSATDFRIQFDLPFAPLLGPDRNGTPQQVPFLLDAPNYDQLRLDVFFGDSASISPWRAGLRWSQARLRPSVAWWACRACA